LHEFRRNGNDPLGFTPTFIRAKSTHSNTVNTVDLDESGVKCGALFRDSVSTQPTATSLTPTDPELAMILAAWSTLPPAIRAGIAAMVKVAMHPHCSEQHGS